ncbi:ribonucleotide reductase subunit alpha [Tahibacter amnicola]|uniref:Ribonucleotide reductase subunit alpha n=1 Tax=Tahibacter amnicola TaxID=2976241 RepID=A0ABY6BKS4_9GAMM|nr:ribonucleotide reductase subunit alpha [Tahibacter amnicola]UXI70499.1 ribonucleotide reductase subunit alpha [Tahibacter amnicola]
MQITHFSDLLEAARRQDEPQRLLMVFASAGLPSDASAAQRSAFANGEGGALTPVLCVDKRPEEIGSFESLREESERTGINWDIVFVAALAGRGGYPPNADEAVQPLRMMVEQIKGGRIGQFVAVSRGGDLLQLRAA